MEKQRKNQIVNNVKSLLVSVVEYQEFKKYDSFDYGYLYDLNVWECEFFDENDNVVERIVTHSEEELLQKLSY